MNIIDLLPVRYLDLNRAAGWLQPLVQGAPNTDNSLTGRLLGGDNARQAADSILEVFANMANSYPGLLALFEAVAYLAGLLMVMSALVRLRHTNGNADPRARSSAIVSFAVGVTLIASPSMLSTLAATFFGDQACNPNGNHFIDYIQNCSTENAVLKPVFMFIQFYGFFAFIRGWFIVNRGARVGASGGQDDLAMKGGMHIVFGLACIYIGDTLRFFAGTFGFQTLYDLLNF